MNRSILIVICDFLLVSLLAFSTVDINTAARTTTGGMDLNTAAPTNQAGGRQDLGDVMRLALEDERKKQDELNLELSKTRNAAAQQQALLSQREEQLQNLQQQVRTRDEQAAQLQQQEAKLTQQMNAAQGDIAKLNQQLHQSAEETLLTQQQRAQQNEELRKEQARAAALQQQLADLEKTNELVNAERERLSGQLQFTEAQKQAATAQLAQAQEDLNLQRQENLKLAQGVQDLAGKSSELAKEIQENRALAPNTIFDEFSTNRVTLDFAGTRPGFFGGTTSKDKQAQTIVVTDGTNTFAVCHMQDTLLNLWEPMQWNELSGTIAHGPAAFPIDSLAVYLYDPRIALMAVSPDDVKQMGCKVYRLAHDPFKFQDAVVVGANDGYYGQCQFQIDLSTPQYLKMDRNTLKGLFGKFNPSTGDLVFSNNGDLLGVMANSTYCIILRGFEASTTIRFGTNVRDQNIAGTLSSLYATVTGLPFKLQ